MRIGVLGSGDVGKVLAGGFAERGDEVMIGSRTPEKLGEFVSQNKGVKAASFEEVAKFGELLVVATAWTGTENALKLAGHDNFKGKVVIDATNPLDFSGGGPGLALGHKDSGGEQMQRWLSDSKVVKAFNIVGNSKMVKPKFTSGIPTMFICGNDDEAKQKVTAVLNDFGWSDVIDIGGIDGARQLEEMCILWVKAGMKVNSWNMAFSLLRD